MKRKIIAVVLWPFLFVGQLIGVLLAMGIVAKMFESGAAPSIWAEFLCALSAIPLAMAAHFLPPLRWSGYWIWVPGVAAIAYDAYFFGLKSVTSPFTGGDRKGALLLLLTAPCVAYSLTLACLAWRDGWLRRALRALKPVFHAIL